MLEFFYSNIAKPILFRMDAETAHELVMNQMGWLRPCSSWLRKRYAIDDERLSQTIAGVRFPSPVGLAGGFDKNAIATDIWPGFGFGFIELGTVTPKPQPGNPRPRLFRYPHEEAIVNRMGFNNDGAETISARLKKTLSTTPSPIPISISLGKQKDTPVDDVENVCRDYSTVLRMFYEHADLFAVNVSSPNTPNLRELQSDSTLGHILEALQREMEQCSASSKKKPLFVKIAPDLSNEQIIAVVDCIQAGLADGIIATNTTNQTDDRETGGLSGAPIRTRSTEVISLIASHAGGTLPIIGCGGIFSAEDAMEKLKAGAWLLQIYTAFVYRGPSVVHDIHQGLLDQMERSGVFAISAMREKH